MSATVTTSDTLKPTKIVRNLDLVTGNHEAREGIFRS